MFLPGLSGGVFENFNDFFLAAGRSGTPFAKAVLRPLGDRCIPPGVADIELRTCGEEPHDQSIKALVRGPVQRRFARKAAESMYVCPRIDETNSNVFGTKAGSAMQRRFFVRREPVDVAARYEERVRHR